MIVRGGVITGVAVIVVVVIIIMVVVVIVIVAALLLAEVVMGWTNGFCAAGVQTNPRSRSSVHQP